MQTYIFNYLHLLKKFNRSTVTLKEQLVTA